MRCLSHLQSLLILAMRHFAVELLLADFPEFGFGLQLLAFELLPHLDLGFRSCLLPWLLDYCFVALCWRKILEHGWRTCCYLCSMGCCHSGVLLLLYSYSLSDSTKVFLWHYLSCFHYWWQPTFSIIMNSAEKMKYSSFLKMNFMDSFGWIGLLWRLLKPMPISCSEFERCGSSHWNPLIVILDQISTYSFCSWNLPSLMSS